jgi:hypothetical protein
MRGLGLSVAGLASRSLTQIQRAIALLRTYGTNAHVYLPGVGTLNGLQAANFLDSAGKTQGTVDQPVGLVLDAEGVLGVELVANGDFSAGSTGWAFVGGSVSSGAATWSGAAADLIQPITVTVGRVYKIAFEVTSYSAGLGVGIHNGAGPFIRGSLARYTTPGVYSEILTATQTGSLTLNGAFTVGQSESIDNISVREITGIHASQSTTPAKPILRRGAVNLLTYSQDFANAAWNANGTKSGSTLLTPTEGVQVSHSGTTAPSATTSTFSFVLSGSGTCSIYAYNGTNGFIGMQTVTLTSTPTIYASTITPTVAGTYVYFGRNTGETATSITFGGAALFQGTYTASQIQALGGIPLTTTAPASTALGPYWWSFDGVDDSLALSGPLFQMSDDHCVIAGVRFTNPAMYPTVLTAAMGSPATVCRMYADSPEWGGKLVVAYTNDAGTTTAAITSAYIAGSDVVFTSTKQGGFCRADMDMVQGTPVAAPAGVFTVGNGSIGGVIAGGVGAIVSVKGSVSSADLITLKRFVASLQGRSI